jgi:outer membrane protein TolC
MRHVVIKIFILLLPFSLAARDLTLKQALEMAREHSNVLKKAEVSRQAAHMEEKAARSERLPTLSASATAGYVSYVPTLDINIPSGPVISREFGTRESYQSDFLVTLPIFTGGRIAGGIGMARAGKKLSDALLSADFDRIAYLTRIEYFTLFRNHQILDVAEASLERTEIIYRDAQSLYSAGAADSVALLDAGLALNRASFASEQAKMAYRSSELRLLTFLGLEPDESLNLTDSLKNPSDIIWEPVVEKTKPELRAARATMDLNRSLMRSEKADYFPTLVISGGYSVGKPNLDRFNNTWNDYFSLGATLKWTFNLGNKTGFKYRKARYKLNAAEFDYNHKVETLGRDARLAVEQIKLAQQKFASAQEEYNITSDAYRLATVQHREGTLSSNRLVTIETDLSKAQASLSAALIEYYMAQSTYYYATGSAMLQEGE